MAQVKKGMGFKAAQKSIASKQGVSEQSCPQLSTGTQLSPLHLHPNAA